MNGAGVGALIRASNAQHAPQVLGEAGVINDDASYSGAQSGSLVSADYYRQKITEFQTVLTALDSAYQAAQNAYYIEGIDPGALQGLDELMREYEAKRTTLRITAEAINAGAAAINAAGGRMPVLSLPATLGMSFALPLVAASAIGAAAALIVWGREWLRGVNERLKFAQAIAAQDTPEAAAALAREVARADIAQREAESSPVSALAPIFKWGAVAVGAFFAWKMYRDFKKG